MTAAAILNSVYHS